MTDTAPAWLGEFIDTYQQLDKHNLHRLEPLYADDVWFRDPFRSIHGRADLLSYFDQLYQNLEFCQFDIQHSFVAGDEVALYWQMHFAHPRLKRGKTVEVTGHSRLKAEKDRVTLHHDYLDAGAMLYEQIPLLGSTIRLLKRRL